MGQQQRWGAKGAVQGQSSARTRAEVSRPRPRPRTRPGAWRRVPAAAARLERSGGSLPAPGAAGRATG